MHHGLLCLASEYFCACLQGRFEEASSLEVSLPDVDPVLFCMFAKWLYTGDVAPFPKGMGDGLVADFMVDLYVLGERLLCVGLRNRAMDILQETLQNIAAELRLAVKVIALGEPLRQSKLLNYLVDQIAYNSTRSGLDRYLEDTVERQEWLELLRALDADGITEFVCRCQWYQEREVTEDDGWKLDPAKQEGCQPQI